MVAANPEVVTPQKEKAEPGKEEIEEAIQASDDANQTPPPADVKSLTDGPFETSRCGGFYLAMQLLYMPPTTVEGVRDSGIGRCIDRL